MIDEITIVRAAEVGLPAAESYPDPPLHSYPLKVDWEATLPVVPESHAWPMPEMAATEVADLYEKAAVAALVRLAHAHGWTVRVTEAIGSWPSVAQRPSVQRRSLAVRMSRGPCRAVAVYVSDGTGDTWTWQDLYRWCDGTFPDLDASIGQFTDALFGRLCKPVMPTDWSCPYFGPVHGPKRPPRKAKGS